MAFVAPNPQVKAPARFAAADAARYQTAPTEESTGMTVPVMAALVGLILSGLEGTNDQCLDAFDMLETSKNIQKILWFSEISIKDFKEIHSVGYNNIHYFIYLTTVTTDTS